MKRADTGKTFLDLDEINKILPKDLELNAEKYSRGVYRAKNGDLISISNSRVYERGPISWFYVYADRYADMGVEYMIFTIGLLGLVLLPMEAFQPYKLGCSWKVGLNKGEKRYRIDVKKVNDSFFFVNSSQRHMNKLDVTPFFIPFK